MPREAIIRPLEIQHITQSQHIISCGLFSTEKILRRSPVSWKEMFIKPYESKSELFFCLRRTIVPMLQFAFMYFNPGLFIFAVFIIAQHTLTCICFAMLFSGLIPDNGNSIIKMSLVTPMLLLEASINILHVPISLTLMLTRGISTILKGFDTENAFDPTQVQPAQRSNELANQQFNIVSRNRFIFPTTHQNDIINVTHLPQ